MDTLKTVCFWLVVLYIGFWFCVGFFGIRRGGNNEEFQPNKMSQVAVPPQRPAWQSPEAKPIAVNPLARIAQGLQRELENLPKPPRNEFQYHPWHVEIPPQEQPPPFEFYEQWKARQPQQRCP